MSAYVCTGDRRPKASPTSTRILAPGASIEGIAAAGVWLKAGADSSNARGSATQSCSPCAV